MADLQPRNRPKADFLVSVALVAHVSDEAEAEAIRSLAMSLAAHFQYWEIVVVMPMTQPAAASFPASMAHIANLRLLRVDNTDNFYRLRLAAVAEAIGDVVVATSTQELAAMDIPAIATRVYEANTPIIMTREPRLGLPPVFSGFLGYLTGYRIDSHDTLTAGFPRAWLSVVLSRSDADLLLRFETRSAGSRFHRELVGRDNRLPRRLRSTGRRLRLLADLMASSAPRVLRAVSLLSFVVTVIAGLYGLYVLGVWAFKPDVSPGWLTTAVVQVVIAGFLGVAFSSISMGIVKLLDRIEGLMRYTVVDEASSATLIGQAGDLNVVVSDKWRQPAEMH